MLSSTTKLAYFQQSDLLVRINFHIEQFKYGGGPQRDMRFLASLSTAQSMEPTADVFVLLTEL